MSPADFRGVLDRFYSTASNVVFDHDGSVDKFVGDEVVAMFFPLLTGERHAARAVEAAVALLRATGHEDPTGPWAPLGAGVHTGPAWVGAVGEGSRTELTVLGDTVNTTARLASAAAAGEILVTSEAAALAGLDPTLERRRLDLKGKQLATYGREPLDPSARLGARPAILRSSGAAHRALPVTLHNEAPGRRA